MLSFRERLPFSIMREGDNFRAHMIIDKFNQRVKLSRFEGDSLAVAAELSVAAREFQAGKIIAYLKSEERASFFPAGFRKEGEIPAFFAGVDAHCLVAYPDSARAVPRNSEKADRIVNQVSNGKKKEYNNSSYNFKRANVEDCRELAVFYGKVFKGSYPTPVSDAAYLSKQLQENTVYWLVWDGTVLCGAASLEVDARNQNAEVTDCAVLPDYRGSGLLHVLLARLEHTAGEMGINCLYSLSRALLPGINRVLYSAGYRYYGRLINNCVICGDFEDMNIWAKKNI